MLTVINRVQYLLPLKRIAVLISIVVLNIQLFAQLQVSTNPPYNSAQYLVESVLLGNGVVASNFTIRSEEHTSELQSH